MISGFERPGSFRVLSCWTIEVPNWNSGSIRVAQVDLGLTNGPELTWDDPKWPASPHWPGNPAVSCINISSFNFCLITNVITRQIIIIRYPADKSQKNLKGQSTQVIWIENYNCIAVAMGPKNQTHLKCSPKELATVVCALRTIVTTCTKNDHCHHSIIADSWPPSCPRDVIGSHNNLDVFVSVFEGYSFSWVFLKLRNMATTEVHIGIHLELRLEETE